MTSAFDNLSGPGKPLKPEPPDAAEFAGLRRSANRYIVLQLLPHTLGLGTEVWRVMARCHDIRNRGEYEGALEVSERLVADLLQSCRAGARGLERLAPI